MTKNWAAEQARRIGDTVSKLRGERSGSWLSNETAKAGHRISRTSIFELETGKRKSVSTAELCVLAWALKVPPVKLLYPALPDGDVEIVPDCEKPSIEAVMWFSGELAYFRFGGTVDDFLAGKQALELVELARERVTLESKISTLRKVIEGVAQVDGQSATKQLVDQLASDQSRINAINARLRQIDGAVVADGG